MTARRVAIGLALVLLGLASCAGDPGPGRVAPDDPVQVELTGATPIRHGDYEILPLASYAIEARVLSVESYRFDRESDLAPRDFALGWGPMSDRDVLRHFDIDQGFRLFTWTTDDFPIPREEVERHAANVHVVAASSAVETKLAEVRPGDVVQLEGSLIEARGRDGWTWRSSLTRHDVGVGACELIRVESVRIR